MKCIECNKTAKYTYWGQSLCPEHFIEHKRDIEESAGQPMNKLSEFRKKNNRVYVHTMKIEPHASPKCEVCGIKITKGDIYYDAKTRYAHFNCLEKDIDI